jgi:hypothetical protein
MFEREPNIASYMNLGDFRRAFHIKQRRGGRVVPSWAYNNEAMRRIFEVRARRVLKMGENVVGTRDYLLKLWAGIVYRCYRLRMTSVECATEMSLTPWQVRQQLRRLNIVARELCPELCISARFHGGGLRRADYLDQKILDLEQKVKRAKRRNRARQILRYEDQLERFRKMKSAEQETIAKATVFKKGQYESAH